MAVNFTTKVKLYGNSIVGYFMCARRMTKVIIFFGKAFVAGEKFLRNLPKGCKSRMRLGKGSQKQEARAL